MGTYGDMREFHIIWKDPKNALILNTMVSAAHTSFDAEKHCRDFIMAWYHVDCEIVSVVEVGKNSNIKAVKGKSLFRRIIGRICYGIIKKVSVLRKCCR
ncbi:MAG: hypothetical protein IJ446_09060 [Oscillospiraceae bacterium]|nr:hypothetical protein [Oscillospiraceae bacterium]